MLFLKLGASLKIFCEMPTKVALTSLVHSHELALAAVVLIEVGFV